ncbi:ubiquitin-protein ligase RKR1 [Spizellomyces punctatus DAOM BR117]|uniref:E3 ubiquitin-protein ligase listerin n=1 Tax=Spizellomyces punctatus (strain DAOM BR117) TaxID=645134 RepID=A0A0L0H9F5_SPIPD|nr:ubiquitin-protein ligase RKR1 [Spizellomyces punctatus DAOM BR117]KNC98170.1 hypothetical protein SPPG_06574 [Spizellomyces punctatus DAOM BR117]|eukprot:XP_016606210.1 hypothetical protein SPPG_06574 [Spizellomyces punctatus DAOM BR117]
MGREKERRVKGNIQPAASSRAAELLTEGFGGLTVGLGAPAFGAGAEWELGDLHGDVKVLFKRLSKRDTVTRIKALEDLSAYVSSEPSETVKDILPAWSKSFNRLVIDADRRVREMTVTVQLGLVRQVRKQFAPYLKQVIGSWFCARFDANKEVARIAGEAFQTAFPSKQVEVLVYCQSEILDFVIDTLLHQTPETMSDPRFTTPEDVMSKYARVVSSCFYMLAYLFDQLPLSEITKSISKYDTLFDNPTFWNMCTHPLAPIRRASYALIKTISRVEPEILKKRLDILVPIFPGKVFSDKDPSTHSELWESLVFFTKACPESWLLPSKRPPLQKLFGFLRHGAFGSVGVSYPSLLALLACLPPEILSKETFAPEFLSNFWQGLESGSIDKTNDHIFLESWFECTLFLIVQSGGQDTAQERVEGDLFRPVFVYLFPEKYDVSKRLKPRNVSTITAKYVYKLSTSSQIPTSLVDCFMKTLERVLEGAIVRGVYPDEAAIGPEFESMSVRCGELLACLAEQGGSVRDSVERIATRLFCRILDVISPNERLSGHAHLLATLSTSFSSILTCPETHTLLTTFLTRLKSLTTHPKPASNILSMLVIYLSVLPSTAVRSVWTQVLDFVFGMDNVIPCFANLMTLVLDTVQADLTDPRIDALVTECATNRLERGEDVSSVEVVVATCLRFGPESPVLTPETVQYITTILQTVLSNFTTDLVIGYHDATHTGRAFTVLHILQHLSNTPIMASMIPDILDLAFVDGEDETGDVREALGVAKRLWEGYVCVDSDVLVKRWEANVGNVEYRGSIDTFVSQFKSIQSKVSDSLTARLIHTPSFWQSLYSTYHVYTPYLALTDPLIPLTDDAHPLPTHETDVYGNSVLVRWIGIILSFARNASFFEDRGWMLGQVVVWGVLWNDLTSLHEHETKVVEWNIPSELNNVLETVVDSIHVDPDFHTRLATLFRDVVNGSNVSVQPPDLLSDMLCSLLRSALDSNLHARALHTALDKVFPKVGLHHTDAVLWMDFGLSVECRFVRGIWNDWVLDLLAEHRDRGIRTLVSRLLDMERKVVRTTGSETAITRLWLLVALLQKDSTTLVDTSKLLNLVRAIRGWYTEPVGLDLNRHVAIFLESVVRHVDVGIHVGQWVLEVCQKWIQGGIQSTPESRVLLFYGLGLFSALQDAAQVFPDTYPTLTDRAQEIYSTVLDIFVNTSPEGVSDPEQDIWTRIADFVSSVPDSILFSVPGSTLYDLLYVPINQVQTTAYGLIHKHVVRHVADASLRVEMRKEEDVEEIPVDVVNSVRKRGMDDPHSTFGYLLSWMILFDHFQDATFDLKSQYVSHLRRLDLLPTFLDDLFGLLGLGSKMFDCSRWDVESFELQGFDMTPLSFSLLSAHLYYRTLTHTPTLLRIWWSECKNRQTTLSVESYTEKYFSPLLISTELSQILNADLSAYPDLSVRVNKTGCEVVACFAIEDAVLEMVIRIPRSFPLKLVDVEGGAGGRSAGISEARWRAWLLGASAVIGSLSGSVLEAVKLFGRNLGLHFQGVEDCAICYSVIGVIDRTLPTKQCKTCKHLFHSSCLYKWFRTSNQSTCPLCRQPTF